ncbi:MAG: hypothetical protein KAT11_00080 [Phycisphaerae bacterium]|nr:hypothetical protein [Phycisphaerae bacterium]
MTDSGTAQKVLTAKVVTENIPPALRQLDQWVCWKKEIRDDKSTKVPYQTNGKRASSTNPATWTTFEDALKTYNAGGYDGIGFVFSPDDSFCGIDLDDCLSEDGLAPWADEILQQLNSYSEISPSGHGVKVWINAKIPGSNHKKHVEDGAFEIYDQGRYFTVTGNHYPGTPKTIEPGQVQIDAIYAKMFPPPDRQAKPTPPATVMPDDDILRIARRSASGALLNQLWSGDTTGHNGDDSAADLALCNILAFYAGPSGQDIVDRLFRKSGLFRPKWDERRGDQTYGQMTIAKAYENRTEFYSRRQTHLLGNLSAKQHQLVPNLPIHRFKLDLYGNADRFMYLYGKDVLWCGDRGQWFVWNGQVWQRDATREVNMMAELTIRAMLKEAADTNATLTINWAVKCNKNARPRTEMLDVVKHHTAVRIDRFDRNPWLLAVQNGVVDLRTGTLLPHQRDQMISILCPTVYDPNASCPLWEKFLDEIMAGDEAMIAALQRMAGYFLTGDISVQILPILYGPGSNGKNVFLDTITGLMGPYAAEAPPNLITASWNDEHPTEIADLCGKRLVVASETEEGRKMRISLVKRLTGNKYLKARFMRKDYFEFERTHKIVLVTNNRPIITEVSNAVWRRLRLIPFRVTIPEAKQDKRLTEKLVAEWPGILAWAVRGCLDWQQRQCNLDLPEAVQEATAEYHKDSDSVGAFIEDRCTVGHNVKIARSTLHRAYEQWAKDTDEQTLSRKAFANRMRGHGFSDSSCTTEHGKRLRAWSGIALACHAEEVPES